MSVIRAAFNTRSVILKQRAGTAGVTKTVAPGPAVLWELPGWEWQETSRWPVCPRPPTPSRL